MDIEKLIEQLNDWNEKYISNLCGNRTIKCEEYCIKDDCLIVKAATALSTLQTENEEMQKQLNMFSEFLCHMTGGLLSKTNYTAQEMISAAEDYQQKVCGECDLRAELEQVKRERDAAVSWAQKYTESIDRPCVACKHNTGDYVCTAICGNCGPMGTESCKWEFDFSGELKED
jgi:hypothetical protein